MNQQEIDAIREAQADLQVAIGWHRLFLQDTDLVDQMLSISGDQITKQMYKSLDMLHDILKENDVIMGRHMEAALANPCNKCNGRRSIKIPVACPECVAPKPPPAAPEDLGLPETRGGWLSK